MNSGLEDIDLFDEDLLLEGEAEDEDGLQEEHEHWRIVADKGQSPMRIDKFLMDHLGDTSRNRIQKAAEAGCIRVDGKPVKSNYKVKPLQVVTLVLDRPKRDWEIVPEDIPLNIVYEDDDLLVIDKPAGMVVHPGCGNYSGTLVNALAWHMKDTPSFDPNDPTVGLVHRIDKDTSGLLVIAKTPEAKTHLCHQFFVKSTKRQYNALVWGNFSEDEGRIEGNIGRNPKDRLQMAVFPPDSETCLTDMERGSLRQTGMLMSLTVKEARRRVPLKSISIILIRPLSSNRSIPELMQPMAFPASFRAVTHRLACMPAGTGRFRVMVAGEPALTAEESV